jgi:hypothetical protein
MSILYTADGSAINTERQEIHWPLEFMRMLAIFAVNCEETQLGLTCGRCDQKLHGANAREDNFWRMECACRTYLGRNPLSNAQKRGQA